MRIQQSYLTNNPCYQQGRKNSGRGYMLHSVGCSQPEGEVFVNSWNNQNMQACVHAFIDAADGTIFQTLPWDYRAWHAGSGPRGSANDQYIGVEMCETTFIKYTGQGANFIVRDLAKARQDTQRAYDAAVELFAYFCKRDGKDPLADGVIISHKEGCARGIATNHGDPESLWNGLGMNLSMDTFRAAVKAKLGNVTVSQPVPASPQAGGTTVNYLVRITATDLNIRRGPGTSYSSKGFIDPNVYTIVEEVNGTDGYLWGRLKSGVGWIALKYATRI